MLKIVDSRETFDKQIINNALEGNDDPSNPIYVYIVYDNYARKVDKIINTNHIAFLSGIRYYNEKLLIERSGVEPYLRRVFVDCKLTIHLTDGKEVTLSYDYIDQNLAYEEYGQNPNGQYQRKGRTGLPLGSQMVEEAYLQIMAKMTYKEERFDEG